MNESSKRGLPPLAWVGIGCGGLVLLGIVFAAVGMAWFGGMVADIVQDEDPERAAVRAFEFVVKMNPDLEWVGRDDEARKFTIRDKAENEEITFSFADLAQGRVEIETAHGHIRINSGDGEQAQVQIETAEGVSTMEMGQGTMPEWVGDLLSDFPNVQVTMSTSNPNQVHGVINLIELPENALTNLSTRLQARSYAITQNTVSDSTAILEAKNAELNREVRVFLELAAEPTSGSLIFVETKTP